MRLSNGQQKSETNLVMDNLVVSLLRNIQASECAGCGNALKGYQLHHKRYGKDITLYDLALLCGDCHARASGVKGVQGTLRGLG